MLLLDDFWWKGEQIVVPVNEKLRLDIIKEAHDSAYAGHLGYTKTLHAVQRNYTWPYMAEQIHKYVRGCHICQRD